MAGSRTRRRGRSPARRGPALRLCARRSVVLRSCADVRPAVPPGPMARSAIRWCRGSTRRRGPGGSGEPSPSSPRAADQSGRACGCPPGPCDAFRPSRDGHDRALRPAVRAVEGKARPCGRRSARAGGPAPERVEGAACRAGGRAAPAPTGPAGPARCPRPPASGRISSWPPCLAQAPPCLARPRLPRPPRGACGTARRRGPEPGRRAGAAAPGCRTDRGRTDRGRTAGPGPSGGPGTDARARAPRELTAATPVSGRVSGGTMAPDGAPGRPPYAGPRPRGGRPVAVRARRSRGPGPVRTDRTGAPPR